MFYILNKLDRRYDQDETNQEDLILFKKLVKDQTKQTNFHCIQWASKPKQNFRNYERFLRHEGGRGL